MDKHVVANRIKNGYRYVAIPDIYFETLSYEQEQHIIEGRLDK